ncbi:cell division control protein Cdc5 [Schizosaccharomyces cryophilus OY26]|uniref:Cell division control protein Cdc5 n=1 Tax=Schizosaccharomyces cryophilus (strain OY26 / ATCC MYA-4695 / CBS 11777 / NBRC 106824 / NRRL Y48691) TaxID=653667 RepID=S9W3M5_SCHCR|nr:cell division control protein Cdc5 [Schizosaccharomyces cryophilus OY26]EPY52545.1 cell division control protein Cdc5 [Schizosaccharomyces cryophilus OY26]
MFKGGAWKNTEDEILKAAVSKYGKNQWARISSLLVRKTPKQCKARWYEWIDPSIKKTEWSREEDEKLLHLAKLLPTQWRTIAPIVGRTATQCLERYQKLLDDLEARENEQLGLTTGEGAEAAPPVNDPNSRLRFGDAEPNLETLPALPDAIDMDEDEKEMLSEARARLANTQGKKAKRKDREKQLELTKRLSQLQKRRELKAAGVNIKLFRRRKNEMDYNASIPFEKKPAIGFYDTSEEEHRNLRERQNENRKLIERGQKSKESLNDRGHFERPKPVEKVKRPNNDAHDEKMRRLAEAEQMSKRRKLNLPAPQVSENELDKVVKLGFAGDRARSMTDTTPAAGHSTGLVGNYSQLERTTQLRTPRSGALEGKEDALLIEARNQLLKNREQSSLLGEENTPLQSGGTGFAGVEPEHPAQSVTRAVDGLPYSQATPYRTPRDTFAINKATQNAQAIADTKAKKIRTKTIMSLFAKLPKPRDDYELMEPRFADEKEQLPQEEFEEDAADRERRLQEHLTYMNRLAQERQSQVIQKGLPRPNLIQPSSWKRACKSDSPAEGLVFQELFALVASDGISHPTSSIRMREKAKPVKELSNAELDKCKTMVLQEMESEQNRLEKNAFDKDFLEIHDSIHNTSNLLPGLIVYEEDDEDVQSAEKIYTSIIHKILAQDAVSCNKLENAVGERLQNLLERSSFLLSKISHAHQALETEKRNLACYEMLRKQEQENVPHRLNVLEREVRLISQINTYAQQEYALRIQSH